MKTKVRLPKILFSVVIAFAILFVSSGSAMSAPSTAVGQDTKGDVKVFRERLMTYYEDLLALYPYIEQSANPDLLEEIKQAKVEILRASDEELLQVMPYFEKNPEVFNVPVQVREILAKADQSAKPMTTDLVTRDNYNACGQDQLTALIAARTAAQVGRFALIFAPSDMVVVVAGTGGTVSAHPVKMLMQIGYESAETAIFVLESLQAQVESCHQNVTETLLLEHEALLIEHHELLKAHDALTKQMANTMELRNVDLQIIEWKEKTAFLITATEGGVPVTGVEFTSIKYATNGSSGNFIDITKSATITMVEPGIYLVKFNGRNNIASARFFSFTVKHTGDVADHFGFILLDRIGVK